MTVRVLCVYVCAADRVCLCLTAGPVLGWMPVCVCCGRGFGVVLVLWLLLLFAWPSVDVVGGAGADTMASTGQMVYIVVVLAVRTVHGKRWHAGQAKPHLIHRQMAGSCTTQVALHSARFWQYGQVLVSPVAEVIKTAKASSGAHVASPAWCTNAQECHSAHISVCLDCLG